MHSKAFIVQTGIITAIGADTASCEAALCAARSGIGLPEILKTHWQDTFPVGEVKMTNAEMAAQIGAAAYWPRTALLSAIAVQEAWSAYRHKVKAAGLRTGFFSANTVGGMDMTEKVFHEYISAGKLQDVRQIAYHECGAVTELVARHFGLTDFVTTISTACSSSANSIMMAAQMIEQGQVDVAVAGGADALARFTLNGFNTLMILDKEYCQPFDQNRRGLNLGEGAGYLLLMSEDAMTRCGVTADCYVSGYANANDAYHQTASSPEGIGNKLAMEGALKQAGIASSAIDYINLHGTGTANNDDSEGKAVAEVFAGKVPPASSTKAYTGHTLGAAGGMEAVFSVLSLQKGLIYPNLRWQTAMENIGWTPVTELQTGRNIRHVLSNSFGFGGNCSALVFSRV